MDPTDDNPFIEHPDEHEPLGDELYCWIPGSGERQCAPDCVAFDTGCEDSEVKTPCLALNILRVIGVTAQIYAQGLRGAQAAEQAEKVTKKIKEIPDPPEVR